MLHCPDEFQMQAYHDGQMTAERAQRVREHLAGCAACQAKFAELSAMSRVFAQSSRPVFLPIASMRLHQAIDAAIEKSAERGFLRIAWAMSAVAACILVTGSAWMMRARDLPVVQQSVVINDPPWTSVPTTADADSLVREQASPVAQWYLADAGRPNDELP